MKIKNLFKMKRYFYTLSVLVCLLGVSEDAWANTYYAAKLIVSVPETETGKGLVYATTSSATQADANFRVETSASSSTTSGSAKTRTFYAHAKPVRGYVFKEWKDVTTSTWEEYREIKSDMDKTPLQVDVNDYTASVSATYSEASVEAYFDAIDPFELHYKPILGLYTVDYTYTLINDENLLETKAWESYTLSGGSDDLTMQSYAGDKVTLSTTVTDGFLGWYKTGSGQISTALSYTITLTDANAGEEYYPQWTNASGNVASVNGEEFATLEEAVDAANNSTDEEVTLTLLNYVHYTDNEALNLTRSMTINLNGKNVYGLAGCLFCVDGPEAVVTIQDGATTKGKILVVDAREGRFQAIEVKKGRLVNNGAAIQLENKLQETKITDSTIPCAVYVAPGAQFVNQSGALKSSAISNTYGIYSEGIVVVSGGSVNSTATKNNAFGIYMKGGDISISGGTITTQANIGSCGLYVDANSNGNNAIMTVSAGTFNITATTRDAFGIRVADGNTIISGGTFTVSTTASTSYNTYGILVGAESIKNRKGYPNNGSLVVSGGTFNVGTASKTTYSYGIYVSPLIANASFGSAGYVATTINDGKFKMIGKTIGGVVNEVAESLQIKGGYYSVNTRLDLNIPASHHSEALSSGTEYNAGYRYQVVSGAPATPEAVCKIGETTFNTLEDAISYANNNPDQTLTILMLKDYVLSQSGKYTIPAKTTLLIPKDANQTSPRTTIYRDQDDNSIPTKAYITLTLGKDVMLDVKGAIEVGGQQNSYNNVGTGRPNGTSYGWLLMKTGSKILLEGGGNLYAWGFITGNGTIDVRRGAIVHEQFQIYDWEGGSEALDMYYDRFTYRVFIFNEYFIQNVEVPATYRPGSALWGYTGLKGNNVRAKLVGVDTDEAALFLMDETDDSEDTWVRKSYDPATDRQIYEVNNSARLGNLHIPYSSYTFASEEFILPLTHNMTIHLLSGAMGVTQSTVLLPGSEIEIEKKSTVYIEEGKSLFLFDYHEWDAHIHTNAYARRIECRPGALPTASIRDISSPSGLGNAKMNIHGTFRADGAIYTTEGGASIFSNNADAGQILFATQAPAGPETPLYVHKYAGLYYPRPTAPAWLLNTDGSYEETVSTAAGKSFCFMNDKWNLLTVDPDNSCFVYDQDGVYYAQPGEYIAINATKDPTTKIFSGNDDHTFSDAAGAGRLFILTEGCQWWEVENVENLYHCIHPLNDTYYYWESDIDEETGIDNGTWEEKKFAISWKNWDGSDLYDKNNDIIIPDMLPYGATPQYLHTPNPERAADIDYTYTFDDWSPALSPVTKDQTYTATYTKEERKYVIVFKNGGVEVGRQFLKHNEMPTPPELTNGDLTLQWNPAISAVTGPVTYIAEWLETPPDEYEITFVDYDGATILKQGNVHVDEMPTAPAIVDNKPMKENGTLGGKPATSEYTYVFDHWSPTLAKVTQAMVYIAVYSEVERTYEVKFFQEDGKTQIGETQNLPLGATPIIPSYSGKENTAQYTYSLEWVDKSSMGEDEDEWIKSVQTVVGNVNYVAHYDSTLNKYTVSLKCNPSGAATLTGAGLYDYNEAEDAVSVKVTNIAEGYEFLGWDDIEGTATTREMAVLGNIDLVANFLCTTCDNVTIYWMTEDGSQILREVSQEKGTATTYLGATPTKEATAQYTYTFDGWTTAPNDEGIYYKNGLTPVAAEGGATYYAHFAKTVNKYNVILESNPAGVCTFAGAGTYKYGDPVTISIVSYNEANYTFVGWSDDVPETITGEVHLVANFSPKTYTVTWMSEDGESILKTDADQAYGAATAYTGATPTKPAGSYVYAFTGWTTAPNGGGLYYINGATPTVTGDVTYYAFFSAIQNDLDIPMNSTVSLTSNVDYTSFTITSNGNSQSGELIGVNYLTITGDEGDAAYFDLAINAQNHRWYAVAVPWKVDAETGISINGRTLRFGIDFDILYYDGDLRASAGANKSAWKYMEDEYSEGNRIMQPGTLYMIGLMMDAPIIRFAKKAGEPLSTTSTSVVAYSSGTGSDVDAGWNGIANPALFHAYLNAGVELGQSYNALTKGYEPINLTTNKLVVGQPVFVQVPSDKAITVAPGGAFAAPRKAPLKETKYEVQIAPAGEDYSDRLFICADNDKETDTYVIGLDLAKFGVTSQVAQIWVDRYDAKLCLNTVALVNETANYPLGISIPESGEYEIKANVQKSDEMALYITYDGGVIWDLSDGAYTLDLNSGTITNYGLRVSAHKTPTIATNLDEAVIDAQGKTCKVLIENKVFIIRGNNVYSVDGQLVK